MLSDINFSFFKIFQFHSKLNDFEISGPSVLDVFNTLVKHLRFSLDNKSTDETKRSLEKKFEEAVINTIGKKYVVFRLYYKSRSM